MTNPSHKAAAADPQAPAIHLQGVTRRFGPVTALSGLDLVVRPGEVVAFLGPNGAGKTTAIDIMLGLGTPDSGTCGVFGMPPRQAVSRGLVSAVMQTAGLLPDVTVGQTVRLTAALFGRPAAATRAMERAGITGITERRVGRCSGGQQQRLRFAMALVSDPSLIILDEPTTGMDVVARREFWDAIRADAADGKTILFATHYLEEAQQVADRVVMVAGGRVVADGSTDQVIGQTGAREVRATIPPGAAHLLLDLTSGTEHEWFGSTLRVVTTDSDAVARRLLAIDGVRDLRITDHGLEDAFLHLTQTTTPGA